MEDERAALHAANRAWWNREAERGVGQKDGDRDWRRVWDDPALGLDPEEWRWCGEVTGRDVCVLGSGDNLACFWSLQ